ncbi:probable glucuronokinase 2 [Glycine soja]|uniref:probable glucuronokinase 2 n=1 Tax=Glycine soja TaxID=3848 RepID=UPI001038E977|nr:probable glucuronokinase 2 [Glycine soja]
MGEIEMRGESNGYARVGLLGNPSDVYYGKTISFSVANFCSTVTLGPSDEPLHDPRDHNFTPSYAINIPRQVNVWR